MPEQSEEVDWWAQECWRQLVVAKIERTEARTEADRLRSAAKRVLEADMRGVRDLDALNALEDAAGFTQQGQRRAAQPEADRAPGEVDAVAKVIAAEFGYEWVFESDTTAENYDAAYWRHVAGKALGAFRSEQGQSRDDTVTEALEHSVCATCGKRDNDFCSSAYHPLGAGRAEGEDRDTENER